jgi:hypothetical protein
LQRLKKRTTWRKREKLRKNIEILDDSLEACYIFNLKRAQSWVPWDLDTVNFAEEWWKYYSNERFE